MSKSLFVLYGSNPPLDSIGWKSSAFDSTPFPKACDEIKIEKS